MTKQITFLDFFAGIGGFRTAVERLGGKCLGFAEIDKHARQSYKALYNTEGEQEWHDITQVTNAEFAELAGQVDLITAGFPCQAFSVAGKRQGLEDSRGTLFYEVARAAKAIRPKFILLENVKGLLSHDKGNTVDVFFRVLNEIGYTIDFAVLNSKYFEVPQNRDRIYITAVRGDLVTQEAWNIEGTGVVAKAKRRFSGYDGIKSFNFFSWSAQHTTVSKQLRDVLEPSAPGDHYYRQPFEGFLYTSDNHVAVKEATIRGCAEAYRGDSINTAQPKSKTRRGRVGRQIANTLVTGREQAVVLDNLQVRYLTTLESWRLQGFSDEQHQKAVDAGVSTSQRYKQAGNSVTVNVIEAIVTQLIALDSTQENETTEVA